MKNENPVLKLGTCSWKYDSWKGIIYSQNVGGNYLQEYAQYYNTVEIDQWFWSLFGGEAVLPKIDTVREYAQAVPPEFKFAVKVPNAITLTNHYKSDRRKPNEPNPHFLDNDLFHDFLNTLAPMQTHLGSLMFQFEYLNKDKMPSQQQFLQRFESFLKKCPAGYTYCLETRNPNYLNKKYFDFLNANNLYHVFVQGYYMPSIFPLYASYRQHIKDLAVIRLHGPDRSGIEKRTGGVWDQIIEPKDSELAQLARMILELLGDKVDVHVYLNNHYEGSAPKSIWRLQELLRDAGL